jgi:hypothetical protein
MARKIELLEPYKWYGEYLAGGVVYVVGKQYNGHTLRDKNADQLIEDGWAREVSDGGK